MGIREEAIKAQEQEAGRGQEDAEKIDWSSNDKYLRDDDDYTGGYGERSLFGAKSKAKSKAIMEIKYMIPREELGECADEQSDKFNYDRMLNDAETAALERLELFANNLELYEVQMSSEEDIDDVEVIVLISHKKSLL